jgi:FMN phosphatase YigB (HAD superfamily)
VAAPVAPPRVVLFDLDETLLPLQTRPRWQWAWRPNGPPLVDRHAGAAIRRSLHAWDRRRWRGLVGAEPPVGWGEYRAHLGRSLTAVADRPLPEAEVSAVVDRFLGPLGPFEVPPDVGPTLARLEARGIAAGILTPIPEEAARGLVKRMGISPLQLVTSDPTEPPVPDRKAFRAAVARFGAKPSQALYVGDLYWSDVRAAARAGLRAVLLDREGRVGPASGERVRSLTELEALIDRPEPAPAAPAGPEPPDGPGPSPPEGPERPAPPPP